MGKSLRTFRTVIRQALSLVLAVLIGLFIAEAVARLFSVIGGEVGHRLALRDPLGAVYGPYGNFGYRQRPGMTERFPNGTATTANSMAYRGPEVSIEKPKGTYRIVLLGGSTTNGHGVNDDETIDAHMRRLLAEQFPSLRFEVVNLGLGGYDSYQDYERMRVDGTRLNPDLVIINSGINDVRNAQFEHLTYPPDPRTLMWEDVMRPMREEMEHGYSLKILAAHYLYVARLPGFIGNLLDQRREIKVIRTVEPSDSAINYFTMNVERTMAMSLEGGAVVVLSTPPSALSIRNRPSDPPERTYWIKNAETTEAYRRKLAARMQKIGAEARSAGKCVIYLAHNVPLKEFTDDAHLTSSGNLTLARNFVQAAIPFIRATSANPQRREHACSRDSPAPPPT